MKLTTTDTVYLNFAKKSVEKCREVEKYYKKSLAMARSRSEPFENFKIMLYNLKKIRENLQSNPFKITSTYKTRYAVIEIGDENLVIKATCDGKKEAKDLPELLEEFLGNSTFSLLSADSIGRLSEVEILTERDWEDHGNSIGERRSYAFLQYMLPDPFLESKKPEGAVFTKLE